jgi:hypothetical protein
VLAQQKARILSGPPPSLLNSSKDSSQDDDNDMQIDGTAEAQALGAAISLQPIEKTFKLTMIK